MKRDKALLIRKLFYIAFAVMEANILFSATGFPLSVSASFSRYISIIFFLVCLLKIFSSKYTFKQAVFYAILLALTVLSAYISGDNRALWFGLTIVCVKDLDKKKLIKNSLNVLVMIFLAAVFCSLVGIIDIIKTDYLGNTRVVLGLGHPNVFSMFCNLIILHLAYLFYEKITAKHIAICTLISTMLFIACQSRTGFLTYLVTLVFFLLFKYTKSKRAIVISCMTVSFFAVAFSILPIVYTPHFVPLAELNSFFTGRLSQAHYYFANYGVRFFGQPLFEELNSSYTQNILDIGYSRMYLYNGLAYYLLVAVGYIVLIRNTIKMNDKKTALLICFFLIYMCSENPGTYIFFNISMLFFFGNIGRKAVGDGKDS